MRGASLRVLWFASGAVFVASAPAAADICDDQPALMRKPCREARDLLMRDRPSSPEPELTVLATGSKDGWRYEYRRPGAARSDTSCSVTAALVLPADTPIRLTVTASDTIREWRLPEFNLALSAIPGRIEEAVIALPLGTADDRGAASGPDGAPVEVRVLGPQDYAEWERRTLPLACRAPG